MELASRLIKLADQGDGPVQAGSLGPVQRLLGQAGLAAGIENRDYFRTGGHFAGTKLVRVRCVAY